MSPKTIKYILSYKIGGFWNTMLTWASDNETVSPDEMAKTISSISSCRYKSF